MSSRTMVVSEKHATARTGPDQATEAPREAPVQLAMAGVGTTGMAALMAAGGNQAMVQLSGGGASDAGGVHAAAARGVQGGGGALPHGERIQAAFGRHDVSGVQAHVGGGAKDASEAMGAEAYATGDHVAFRGAPDLHTAAHEAAHTVQQRAGVALRGGVGQTGDAYERHADQVADAVVQGKPAEPLLDRMAGGGGGQPAVQRRPSSVGEMLPSPGVNAPKKAGSKTGGTDMVQLSPASGLVPTPTPAPAPTRQPNPDGGGGPARTLKPHATQAAPVVTCAKIPISVPPIIDVIPVGPIFVERTLALGGSLALTQTPKGAGGAGLTAETGDRAEGPKVKVSAELLSSYAQKALGSLKVDADLAQFAKTGRCSPTITWGNAVPGGKMEVAAGPGSLKCSVSRAVDQDLGGGYKISGTITASLTLRAQPNGNATSPALRATLAGVGADHQNELIAAGVLLAAATLVVLAAPAAGPALMTLSLVAL